MSEIIQGCSPTPNCAYSLAPENNTLDSTTSTGVDLGVLVFAPSEYLWRAHLIVYGVMFASATAALIPFWADHIYWPVLWAAFLSVLLYATYTAKKRKNQPAIRVWMRPDSWRIIEANRESQVVIGADVLLWSWLIILPLTEISSGKKHVLVALPDSLNKEDWRRLSTWLRTFLY